MKSNIVEIAGAVVGRIFYRGEPVVTFGMVDEIHERPSGTAGRTFRDNRERFEEEADFVTEKLDVLRRGFPGSFPARGGGDVILITRRGYLKLVKPMTDDRAWQVQGEMIDRYFVVEDMLAGKIAAPPTEPAIRTDMTARDWMAAINLVRQTHGRRAARLALEASPLRSLVEKTMEAEQRHAEAMACLSHLLNLQVGGNTVYWHFDHDERSKEMKRKGIWIDGAGVFLTHATSAFADTRWADGAHKDLLKVLYGVEDLAERSTSPWAGLFITDNLIWEGRHA